MEPSRIPDGLDVRRRRALVLYSDQAAAAQGPPLAGFSGSPVMVGGMVVGHLTRVLSSKDRPGRPELGYLFATPGFEILRVLGRPADGIVGVSKVEPPAAIPSRRPVPCFFELQFPVEFLGKRTGGDSGKPQVAGIHRPERATPWRPLREDPARGLGALPRRDRSNDTGLAGL